ncbi:MAG: SDR family oxidoreductase [Spirochaetaceae bacterium]|nr:MAG: SDR family oxidoreductase [Spirochaetaceae bacterium]
MTSELVAEDGMKRYYERNPMHRSGKVPELAKLVAWLASEESTYVNAQNIAADGGITPV